MNTEQRKLLRNACYFFAVVGVLGGCGAFLFGEIAISVFAFIMGAALVFAGKFIWAGRPVGQLQGLGHDLREIERVAERTDPKA
jgi:hypothetical protein